MKEGEELNTDKIHYSLRMNERKNSILTKYTTRCEMRVNERKVNERKNSMLTKYTLSLRMNGRKTNEGKNSMLTKYTRWEWMKGRTHFQLIIISCPRYYEGETKTKRKIGTRHIIAILISSCYLVAPQSTPTIPFSLSSPLQGPCHPHKAWTLGPAGGEEDKTNAAAGMMAICSAHTTTISLRSPCTTTVSNAAAGLVQKQVIFLTSINRRSGSRRRGGGVSRTLLQVSCSADGNKPVVIGLAADSGCGKSTFMRRLTSVFGGAAEPPRGGNPDSNTLISDTTTVICLDDYHSLDRTGRKEKGVTALDPRANNFDLMYEQVKAIKQGQAVQKPIYNHVTGLLDPPELITPPKIFVIEGLHPM
jgi:hypothetical protein